MYLFGLGIIHVVLLTHVDSLDLITKGDFIDIYRCTLVKCKVMNDVPFCKHIFWDMSL